MPQQPALLTQTRLPRNGSQLPLLAPYQFPVPRLPLTYPFAAEPPPVGLLAWVPAQLSLHGAGGGGPVWSKGSSCTCPASTLEPFPVAGTILLSGVTVLKGQHKSLARA